MSHQGFSDFGELYRAAFAEPNLERKLFLLSEVRKVMERWEKQQDGEPSVAVTDPDRKANRQAA